MPDTWPTTYLSLMEKLVWNNFEKVLLDSRHSPPTFINIYDLDVQFSASLSSGWSGEEREIYSKAAFHH